MLVMSMPSSFEVDTSDFYEKLYNCQKLLSVGILARQCGKTHLTQEYFKYLIGDYKGLDYIGVRIYEANNTFRPLNKILEDLSNKWQVLTYEQKRDITFNIFNNNKEDSSMNTKYELYERLEDYFLVIGLPGFKKEDIKIQLKDKTLYITPYSNDNYDECLSFDIDKISEDYGGMLNSGGLDIDPLTIHLPEINEEVYADDIEAKMEDGLLKITIKKSGKITNVEIE